MYDLTLVHVIAKEIANKQVGLYVPNISLADVPFNYYLKNISVLEKFAKQSICNEVTGNPESKIIFLEDPNMELNIVGCYDCYKDNHYIIVNGKHNTCWKRFAHIKELCSLYVNHYAKEHGLDIKKFDDYTLSLEDAYAEKHKYRNDKLDKNDLDSDTFAVLLAAELMIPPVTKYREHTSKLIDRCNSSQITMNDVAKSLSMPEYVLQRHIESGYYNTSCEFYSA